MIARSDRLVLDVGTGDGRAVIERARREPTAFIIGMDASAPAMAEVSRRAAASPSRGDVPNALFVVASAEQPPCELACRANEVTILFPWGSLLRGVLALDDRAAAGIASLIGPGGRATALVSITERDRLALPGLATANDEQELRRRWRPHGLDLETVRPATAEEIRATGSTWARRLRAGTERPAWHLELR